MKIDKNRNYKLHEAIEIAARELEIPKRIAAEAIWEFYNNREQQRTKG